MNSNLVSVSGKMGSGKDTVGQIIQYLVYDKKAREDVKGYIWCDEMFLEDLEKDPEMFKTEPYKIVKFAGKLKDCVCLLLGCTREQLEDQNFKKTPLGEEWSYYVKFDNLTNKLYSHSEYKEFSERQQDCLHKVYLTPRLILQLLGTDCGRNIIHPEIWVNSTMVDYKPYTIITGTQPDVSSIHLEERWPKWLITDCRFPNELRAIKEHGGITIRVNRPCKICGGIGYHKMSCPTAKSGEHESETAIDKATYDYVIDNDGTLLELIQKMRILLIELKMIPW